MAKKPFNKDFSFFSFLQNPWNDNNNNNNNTFIRLVLNPLSPNIHIQILQTDLYTFPLRIS